MYSAGVISPNAFFDRLRIKGEERRDCFASLAMALGAALNI